MRILIIIALFFFSSQYRAQENISYKEMMQDNSYNFYDVVRAAESHFEGIDKEAKGSGWKPYQRWKFANEYKFYPDGNRTTVDPYFVENQYRDFLKKNQSNKSLFQGKWKDLGPYTIDSITGQYSVGLGRVEDFYVSPIDSNKIYLASRSGGFWRSSNGGTSWSVSTDSLVATGVNTMTVSPTNSDSILINVRNARNGYSHGIYRSTDGGISWSQTAFNPSTIGFGGLGDNFQIYEVAYHPRVKDLVFIGTNKGIYRSADNMLTWSIRESTFDFIEIAFHPTNDSIVYLYNTAGTSTSDRVFRTTDQGNTYSLSNFIPSNFGNERVELVTSPDCASCLYFASNNGVWKSTDEGLNFTFLSNSPESCGGFAVSDVDTSFMVYGYVDLDASSNGGRSFINRTRWALGNTNGSTSGNAGKYATSSNYIHADVRNAKAINGVFYVATDGFLVKSNDNGMSWTRLSEGTGIRENYNLGVSQSNHERTISGSQDNGTSIYTEKGWVEFYGADGMEGIIHPLNENWMLGSLQFGGRRLTKDGGFSQSSGTPLGSTNSYWVAPLAYDPNNHMRIFDFRDSVFVSDDFASTYSIHGSTGLNGDIQFAAIAENNSDIVVISRGSAIEKSIDGGQTFSSIRSNLPNYSIRDIAFDPNDDDVMIVVYGRYQADNQKVFLTTNGGTSWSNITYNLGSLPISSVVIDHTSASNIYLGAEIGVYTKAMSGNSWTLYNPGLPNMDARELEINYGSNTLRTATWGRGLWEYHLVGRANYPAIIYTSISNTPDENNPKVSVDQFVTSRIHYSGTLSAVYLEWSKDSAVFGNRINMSNTIDSTWFSNQAIPQFPAGTKMYFKVFAVGSANDTTETYKFMYEVQPFDYCTATGNTSSGNLYLNNVTLRNLNNTSLNNGYSNNTTPIVEVFADSTYIISMTANTSWSLNDFGAWIDYNGDANFDVSERILYDPNTGNSSSNAFTVPSNVQAGDTVKMRVRLSYWTNPAPCGNYFGEVEDYLVVLRDITTSIEQIERTENSFSIAPNPNDGNFNIQFEQSENALIRLFDTQGKKIHSEFQGGRNKVDFNLSISKGNYLLIVGEGKDRQSQSFIVK